MVLGRELRVWLLSHGTRATSDLLSGAVIARRAGGTSSVTAVVAAAVAAAVAVGIAGRVAAVVARAAKKAVTGTVAAGGAGVVAAIVAGVVAATIAITCQPSPIACATDSIRDHWRMLRRETCLLVVWYELPTAGRREHGDVDEHPAHRSGRATAMLDRHARSQTGAPALARGKRDLSARDRQSMQEYLAISRDDQRVITCGLYSL